MRQRYRQRCPNDEENSQLAYHSNDLILELINQCLLTIVQYSYSSQKRHFFTEQYPLCAIGTPMSEKLWKLISLLLFLKKNSLFHYKRKLVTFLSCSDINIAGNDELCISNLGLQSCPKCDIIKSVTYLKKRKTKMRI